MCMYVYIYIYIYIPYISGARQLLPETSGLMTGARTVASFWWVGEPIKPRQCKQHVYCTTVLCMCVEVYDITCNVILNGITMIQDTQIRRVGEMLLLGGRPQPCRMPRRVAGRRSRRGVSSSGKQKRISRQACRPPEGYSAVQELSPLACTHFRTWGALFHPYSLVIRYVCIGLCHVILFIISLCLRRFAFSPGVFWIHAYSTRGNPTSCSVVLFRMFPALCLSPWILCNLVTHNSLARLTSVPCSYICSGWKLRLLATASPILCIYIYIHYIYIYIYIDMYI